MVISGVCDGSVWEKNRWDGDGFQYDERTCHRSAERCKEQVRRCERVHPPFGQGKPILLKGLSESAPCLRFPMQYEQERELLGQRPDGELLEKTQTGMAERTTF